MRTAEGTYLVNQTKLSVQFQQASQLVQNVERFGNWICLGPQLTEGDANSVGSLRKS
jgi:hypothetical protein